MFTDHGECSLLLKSATLRVVSTRIMFFRLLTCDLTGCSRKGKPGDAICYSTKRSTMWKRLLNEELLADVVCLGIVGLLFSDNNNRRIMNSITLFVLELDYLT